MTGFDFLGHVPESVHPGLRTRYVFAQLEQGLLEH
jgi:hypothetical protein